jgi:hypothetical protein
MHSSAVKEKEKEKVEERTPSPAILMTPPLEQEEGKMSGVRGMMGKLGI